MDVRPWVEETIQLRCKERGWSRSKWDRVQHCSTCIFFDHANKTVAGYARCLRSDKTWTQHEESLCDDYFDN